MHAIDTNVLVRLLVRDDPRQLNAAEKFIVKGAWVSHMVLVETLDAEGLERIDHVEAVGPFAAVLAIGAERHDVERRPVRAR